MNLTTILVLHAENGDLITDPHALADQINAFIMLIKANGYPKCDIYVSALWFNPPRFH